MNLFSIVITKYQSQGALFFKKEKVYFTQCCKLKKMVPALEKASLNVSDHIRWHHGKITGKTDRKKWERDKSFSFI